MLYDARQHSIDEVVMLNLFTMILYAKIKPTSFYSADVIWMVSYKIHRKSDDVNWNIYTLFGKGCDYRMNLSQMPELVLVVSPLKRDIRYLYFTWYFLVIFLGIPETWLGALKSLLFSVRPFRHSVFLQIISLFSSY